MAHWTHSCVCKPDRILNMGRAKKLTINIEFAQVEAFLVCLDRCNTCHACPGCVFGPKSVSLMVLCHQRVCGGSFLFQEEKKV